MDVLERLAAIEGVRRTEARYARLADAKDWTGLACLFTEDGVFEPRDGKGNAVFTARGRSAIAHDLATAIGQEATTIHTLFTAEIEIIDSDRATCVQSMADLIFRPDGSPPVPGLGAFTEMRGWGYYHSTYVRADDDWLIAERTAIRTRVDSS